jgi:hypothetical protein
MASLHNDNGSQLSYFAIDGSYGDADGMVVVDTAEWSPEQWMFISEDADDYNRGYVAELFENGASVEEVTQILVDTANHSFLMADYDLDKLREGNNENN